MRRRQRRWVEEDDGRERKEEEEEEEEEEGEKGERGETEGVGVTLVEWREESVVGNIVAYSERKRERGLGAKRWIEWETSSGWYQTINEHHFFRLGCVLQGFGPKLGTFHMDQSAVLEKK